MKRKRKCSINVMFLVLIFACLLTGCKGKDETPPASEMGQTAIDSVGESPANNSGEQTAISNQSTDGNTIGRIVPENIAEAVECPEGYVYDYQVSMEPIPEEIAALGGPCQGTIHAFPSKIGMALTELEMAKDPVLKAEVEKRIPEIEAALEEEIGGDFTVDGVIEIDKFTWIFLCTDNTIGYQFDLYYANHEYNGLRFDNIIYTDDYYDEIESDSLREDLLPIIKEIYKESTVMVRLQSGVNVADIVIIEYTDKNIDKCIEQKEFLKLWEQLQIYNTDLYYNINLSFYSPEYKKVMEDKMTTRIRYDFCGLYSEKVIYALTEKENIWSCLFYSESRAEEALNNIDIYLDEYKSGNYNEEIIWEYWIP